MPTKVVHTVAFWKNLNKNTEELTQAWKVIQELQPKQAKELIILTEAPPSSWRTGTVGIGLFYVDS